MQKKKNVQEKKKKEKSTHDELFVSLPRLPGETDIR